MRPPAKVLIVDDEAGIRQVLQLLLEQEGYTCRTAADGFEGLTALHHEEFDVVLVDLRMPHLDGIGLLTAMQEAGMETVPIILTAYADVTSAVEVMKLGAFEFVTKPVNTLTLPRLLETAVNYARVRRHSRANERLVAEWEVTFDACPNLMAILDPEGRIIRCNRSMAGRLGLSKADAVGVPFVDLMEQAPEAAGTKACRRTLAEGIMCTEEVQAPRLGGDFLITTAPLCNPDGRLWGAVYLARDLTERKQLEAQLRQAQKMEAIGRLAGGIAHDFNNLLTIMMGYSDLLLQQLSPSDRFQQQVLAIKQAGERAANLTRQLLAFSRQQVIQPQLLDLNALVTNLEKMLRRLLSEDLELVTRLDPTLGRVKADPGQLEQVLVNLAVNARDAMLHGGKITIATANVDLDLAYVRAHRGAQPGSYVGLTVEDTGHGMDQKTLTHIFEPFFTTKEPGKGTGLGLATVYGIVKQNHGYIQVDSTPGEGTIFTLYLPRIAAAVKESASEQSAVMEPSQGSETVLLVENEDEVRVIVRQFIQQAGYTVLEAANGPEALRLCARHAGPIDLVLTDVIMPQMSGPALVRSLVSVRPSLKVLYMSGYPDEVLASQGVLETGALLLQKPFTGEALIQKVRMALET